MPFFVPSTLKWSNATLWRDKINMFHGKCKQECRLFVLRIKISGLASVDKAHNLQMLRASSGIKPIQSKSWTLELINRHFNNFLLYSLKILNSVNDRMMNKSTNSINNFLISYWVFEKILKNRLLNLYYKRKI